MSHITRTSKYKHVFCEPAKAEGCFTNLRLSNVAGEQQYIKANALFFAVGVQGGGGPFSVFSLAKPGRQDNPPIVIGHTAPVTDFDFNPFDDHILASSAEDHTVKVGGRARACHHVRLPPIHTRCPPPPLPPLPSLSLSSPRAGRCGGSPKGG